MTTSTPAKRVQRDDRAVSLLWAALRPVPLPEVPVASQIQSEHWDAALADLVLRGLSNLQDADLQALGASYKTGNPKTDDTRQTILRLLAQRLAQTACIPVAAPLTWHPLPVWPEESPSPLPPFHPSGLAGTSLVSACTGRSATPCAASLATWLKLPVDEIVVVVWSPTPQTGCHASQP